MTDQDDVVVLPTRAAGMCSASIAPGGPICARRSALSSGATPYIVRLF